LGNLDLGQVTKTTDAGAGSQGSSSAGNPSTTSNNLGATTALPDTDSGALHGVLTAEGASVLGVLGDFDLLDLFAGSATVTGAVLADDSDLLGTLGLQEWSD
jgi:hypothetical protein